MDVKIKKEIEEIIDLFETSTLSELEIEKEGIRIRLKKGDLNISSKKVVAESIKQKKEKRTESSTIDEDLIPIKTPMVGTFYQALSPESPPFVEEGDLVEPDQVLCIIEAMKLMNEIKAEVKGQIAKVLVKNGNSVEYGQTLFLIRQEK